MLISDESQYALSLYTYSSDRPSDVPLLMQELNKAINTPAQSSNTFKSHHYLCLLSLVRHLPSSQIERSQKTRIPAFASVVIHRNAAYSLRMPQLR